MTGNLRTAIGNDLIDIHVELCPAAAHPDIQGEHGDMPAFEEFIAHPDYQVFLVGRKAPGLEINLCTRLLEICIGTDHLCRHRIVTD
jgi:hypothetical protein